MRTDRSSKPFLLLVVFVVHDALFLVVQIVQARRFVGVLFSPGSSAHPAGARCIRWLVASLFYLWDMIPRPAPRK